MLSNNGCERWWWSQDCANLITLCLHGRHMDTQLTRAIFQVIASFLVWTDEWVHSDRWVHSMWRDRMRLLPKWERGEFESSEEHSGWEKKLRQQTLAFPTIASTSVVLRAYGSVAIPRRVLERCSARATDNWSQIYLAKTTRDDELHGVNLMESWTDIEKLVDVFCREFFPEKAHDLYCSICNQQLKGKTSASVMSHQSDSERCRYIQRNNLKPVKKASFTGVAV